MNKSEDRHMPRGVAKRIMKRGAESDDRVVVTFRKGIPSRVFGYREYQKMVELPNLVKPWERRRGGASAPDPLGAIDAEPPHPLTRKSLYDED